MGVLAYRLARDVLPRQDSRWAFKPVPHALIARHSPVERNRSGHFFQKVKERKLLAERVSGHAKVREVHEATWTLATLTVPSASRTTQLNRKSTISQRSRTYLSAANRITCTCTCTRIHSASLLLLPSPSVLPPCLNLITFIHAAQPTAAHKHLEDEDVLVLALVLTAPLQSSRGGKGGPLMNSRREG